MARTDSSEQLGQKHLLAMSAADLAARLEVSLRHLRRLDSAGKLPRPVRLGRSVRWPVTEIESWLNAGGPDRQRWQAIRGAKL